MRDNRIKSALDRLLAARYIRYLANDPLSFCHRYHDPADREVAAVIASSFAYGAVGIIFRTLETIFAELGTSPRRFAERFDPRKGLRTFRGFKHRFNDEYDLCALLWHIRRMLEEEKSVERFFLRFHDKTHRDVTESLNGYSAAARAMDYQPVFSRKALPKSFLFLFPAPFSGSACKRLCMFLRWVARPDDGVDLGLWRGVSPAQLIIPVDTHIHRISRYIGLSARKTADWSTANEITATLRRMDPTDPVKYDFALAHLGISDKCDGNDRAVCMSCGITEICSKNDKEM